jgi:uncharacterized repeat protein (TIGR01451 family)
MKTIHKLLLTLVFLGTLPFQASAQLNFWSVNNQSPGTIPTDKAVARQSYPREFKLFNLSTDLLRQQLFSIVDSNALPLSTVIFLPNANGGYEQFEVVEASNFEPALQERFPEIRAFSGKGITDRYATLKLSISPQGIQTMVFRTETDNEFIEAYSEDHTIYAVFRSQRTKGKLPWICSTEEQQVAADIDSQLPPGAGPQSNTGQLKTMRLAQSCNGEYSNFFGAFNSSQVALVLAAYNATLSRCNGCYEKDLAVHLNLIANTTAVIYYDPATDPYTTMGSWNSQLQSTLNSVIGAANYDIGHMFGASGGGGNAGCIGCVCNDSNKGSGITSPADGIPMGDNFDVDYVVHEVGHQMGANHTFSHTLEGSGQNKEVGSGITIMGYAGITGQDVAPHSIDIFHETSIQQIQNNLANKTCPITTVMTANHVPVVAPVSNVTIPITTPFTLTGSATDPEGDPLTYCWEQNDNATTSGANSVASPTKLTGPNWLSFSPTSSPTRTFPRLSTVLAGLAVTPPLPGGDAGANIEALSSVSRTLNFRLTVRDNRPYVPSSTIGQTQFTDTTVTVTNTSGPFQVTSPNSNVSWAGGSSQTITWNVNNTTLPPVSCANVKISLSTDGGQTFPTVLLASTANDGSESVTIPAGASTTARVKVEAIGNVFFDISNTNFTITGPAATPTPTPTLSPGITPSPTPTVTPTPTPTSTPSPSVSPTPCGTTTFTNPAAITIPAGAPGVTQGAATPYPSNITVSGTTGTVTKVTVKLNNITSTFPGDFDLLLVGPAGQSAVIMSDCGGGGDVSGVTITLDDAAAANMTGATLVTGTFKPTNLVGVAPEPDTWPAPAPAPPAGGASALSVFNGTSANGTWNLYVFDDAAGDVGSFGGGWELSISTTTSCGDPASPTPSVTPSTTPNPTATATATATATPTATATAFPSPFTFPDLVLTMTDSPDPVQVGNNLTYTITVSNVDPVSSMTATMTDHLPAGVNFVSASPSQGSCTGTSTVVCDLGFIVAGANATVSLVVTPTTAGTLSNTASVPDFEDPTPLNNTDTELTTVIPASSPTATPATPTPTPTPPPTATPTPSPSPGAQAVNLSTRMRVATGDNAGIGGFIITGTAPKHVLLRAIGPSITGLPGVLADPVLELHGPAGFATVTNNNWQDDPVQAAAIIATGLAPTNNLEAAIDATLNPGAYTGIVKGNGNTTGIGLVEVYDLSQAVLSKLANISTRALVGTGNDIVIAGFILGNNSGSTRLVLRGIGGSLTLFGIPNALANPTLELRDANAALLTSNDNWQADPAQAAELTAAGLAPTNASESGIAITLGPGQYTALLAGQGNTTGVGVIEVFDRGAP